MNSLTNPKFQAYDSNGDPLSGGLLYTYESGTTTNKLTYSDVDLTTPNANPVVLDSLGQASVFGNGTYTFVLKDSGGTSQWTMDGVFAASSVTDASGNVVVTSTDAGATAGPYIKLYRNSATPADNDLIGSLLFEGKNDNSERTSYGEIKVKITDASDGTEDAELGLWTMVAGTLTTIATVLPTGIDSDIVSADGSVVLSTGAANTAATIVLATEGLQLWDTDDSHKLSIAVGSNLSAAHTLTFTTGDADRTITLSGNPTLSDWFNQEVKTTSSPTFVTITPSSGTITTNIVGSCSGSFATAQTALVGGSGATAAGTRAIAIGNSAVASGQEAIAIGDAATASGAQAIAIGDASVAAYDRSISIGYSASAGHAGSITIGDDASASVDGTGNTVIGDGAVISGPLDNCIVLGLGATSQGGDNEIMLGNASTTDLLCYDTTITSPSDERDKTEIAPVTAGLDFINALQPKTYKFDRRELYFDTGNPRPRKSKYATDNEYKDALRDWKRDRKEFFKNPAKDGSKKQPRLETGFIAQEVNAASTAHGVNLAHLKLIDNDEKEQWFFSSVDLIPYLVKAIQELTARIAVLEGP